MAITAILGDVVRIGPSDAPILVKDASKALVDPVSIAISIKRPDGSTATGAPTKDSTGTYHYDYEAPALAAMVGTHTYRIVTTSPDAAYEDTITYARSPLLT